jgi:hypothetical protein
VSARKQNPPQKQSATHDDSMPKKRNHFQQSFNKKRRSVWRTKNTVKNIQNSLIFSAFGKGIVNWLTLV